MARYKHESDVFSGDMSDVLLLVDAAAQKLNEAEAREVEVDYHSKSDYRVLIRIKR